ncbi:MULTISPECIES: nucleotidyl transferase AbiEii/AbiGii toxin family protein [unclassified Variovorax]|uniref:nucleotidyl transferase AbiEii/AbiGii toxin family protein n=1 Tax=unclassified Variovorax TaxID=663243 RepID=UPI00076CEF1F|nr:MULTISPECIES: nucleotidyl transferase AbiEii/AbiGii toxin family protein [unclassified Variovorax]KWT67016.1 hypothetical protein APY03_7124 [Variovorax sp. WDL1]PNG49142.1 hypothetical protein CHC06_06379 [Variovorax sp. B2]PNG49527.1 hypothetical protein CHC07_06436 [Variovorax sp. B4]VTV18833.1 hypothetical protein WDL1P2_00461 [Variovorax sp. WDL1]
MTSPISAADFLERKKETDARQDAALDALVLAGGELLAGAKLSGGTALSRFHLCHRLSYDLDFFVPQGFDAQAALSQVTAARLLIDGLEITHDAVKADQLHFVLLTARGRVKVSFVEDMYAETFPALESGLVVGSTKIMTEAVPELYHRKLRTVVGWAGDGATTPPGGRQTARDMFDLYVLSIAFQPLPEFVDSLPYAFPIQAFYEAIPAMPWFDLVEELDQTVASPRWAGGRDVDVLRDHIYAQLGMIELPDDAHCEGAPE